MKISQPNKAKTRARNKMFTRKASTKGRKSSGERIAEPEAQVASLAAILAGHNGEDIPINGLDAVGRARVEVVRAFERLRAKAPLEIPSVIKMIIDVYLPVSHDRYVETRADLLRLEIEKEVLKRLDDLDDRASLRAEPHRDDRCYLEHADHHLSDRDKRGSEEG